MHSPVTTCHITVCVKFTYLVSRKEKDMAQFSEKPLIVNGVIIDPDAYLKSGEFALQCLSPNVCGVTRKAMVGGEVKEVFFERSYHQQPASWKVV